MKKLLVILAFILLLASCLLIGRQVLYQAISGPRNSTNIKVVSDDVSNQISNWLGVVIPIGAKDLYYVDDGRLDPYIYMRFDITQGELEAFIKNNSLTLDEKKLSASDAFYTEPAEIGQRYSWWLNSNSIEGGTYSQKTPKFAYLSIFIVKNESKDSIRVFIESWDT